MNAHWTSSATQHALRYLQFEGPLRVVLQGHPVLQLQIQTHTTCSWILRLGLPESHRSLDLKAASRQVLKEASRDKRLPKLTM